MSFFNFNHFSLGAFFFALLVVLGVLFLFQRRTKDQGVRGRVQQLSSEWSGGGFEQYEEYQKKQKTSESLAKILGWVGIDPASYEKKIKLSLEQAGLEGSGAVINYVFAKRIGPFIGGALALLLITTKFTGAMKLFVWGLAAFVFYLGFKGADIFLKNLKQKRQYQLQRSFPDALDLILVCVEAGLALDAALNRVCRELEAAHPVIAEELNKLRIELTLLNDRQKALQNLAERTDMVAFRAFTGAMLQSERFGTSLTETLRVLAEDYRNTRMMMAENKANRLPALITVPLMLFMMPAFIMILMGPAIIKLMDIWGSHGDRVN
jgi:tight adherence protein C